jgi:glycosyltransferase involved in cell wall biosynthesis
MIGTKGRGTVRIRERALQRRAEVCVLVPVFNYERYLEACLRSVLVQDGVDLTVLVLDDSSTDNSLSIARKIGNEDPRVRIIAHKKNLGHIPTVNEGVAAADGEYIVKLDADDMLTEGSLKRSVALMQAYPSVGFVYGRPAIIIDDGPKPSPRAYARLQRSWTIWSGEEWLKSRFKKGANCILQPEAAIRLSALREVGPYREELPHTSDLEMWMRLATRYDVGRINGSYQGYYRQHSASMSRTVNGGPLTDVSERARAFDSLLCECSDFLSDASSMSETGYRVLAREALRYAIPISSGRVIDQRPADDYVTLAFKLYDRVESLPEWRTLRHLSDMRGDLARKLSLKVHDIAWDSRCRMRWWRWRWSGV